MNRFLAMAFAAALVATSARGATVDVVEAGRQFGERLFFRSTANGANPRNTLALGPKSTSTARFDDVADTGVLLSSVTAHNALINGLGTRSFQIGPPNFPDPNPTTVVFSEAVSVDSVSYSAAVNFVSSTTAPLTPNSGQFRFQPDVTLAFPDSFTVAGSYKITGPSTTSTTPFSVKFNRVSAANVTRTMLNIVDPGANYPTTAKWFSGLLNNNLDFSAMYQPETTTVFSGAVDGVNFLATMQPARLRALATTPEPAGATLWAIALCAGAFRARRRRAAFSPRF